MTDVTIILQKIERGERHAAKDLLPLVYDELRKLAGARMSAERTDHTLQPTALVHEAYLRLVGHTELWQSRGHFFAAAAEAMRRILIDHARAKNSLKRTQPSDLRQSSPPEISFLDDPERMLELDDALTKLETEDGQIAKLIQLRLFGGLKLSDAAVAMNIPKSTAHDWWRYALHWFRVELQND